MAAADVDDRDLRAVARILRRLAKARRPGEELKKAIRRLERLQRVRARSGGAPDVYQRPLRIIQPAPISGPLREWDQVRCRMGGTVLARACLDMRSRVWPSGAGKGAPRRLECVGCALGAEYAARLPGYVPPPSTLPAEVLSPKQRAARAQWKREHEAGDAEPMDPLKVASDMTRTDESDWRA